MPTVRDEIQFVGLRAGLVITDCLAKLQLFCKIDAFPRYDRVGYEYAHQKDTFHPDLLKAVNGAMFARSPRKAWIGWLDRPLQFLSAVPDDVDAIDSDADEYQVACELLRMCYEDLTETECITDMAASKMLHLKRPRLVAISDSYVRIALAVSDPDRRTYPPRGAFFAERAIRACNAMRAVGQANQESLSWLQQELSAGCPSIALSKLRILDMLIWTDMAIGEHKVWTPQAEVRRWSYIGWRIHGKAGPEYAT